MPIPADLKDPQPGLIEIPFEVQNFFLSLLYVHPITVPDIFLTVTMLKIVSWFIFFQSAEVRAATYKHLSHIHQIHDQLTPKQIRNMESLTSSNVNKVRITLLFPHEMLMGNFLFFWYMNVGLMISLHIPYLIYPLHAQWHTRSWCCPSTLYTLSHLENDCDVT